MKKSFFLVLLSCVVFQAKAQLLRARMLEDFTIQVERISSAGYLDFRDDAFEQLPGFPKGTAANPTFKNLRNVTLADLDGDEVVDILFATNNKLFAYAHDTLLWEKELAGVAIYPPSMADLDNDSLPEIVQVTGGVPNNGRVYLLDHTGTDLPGWPLSFNDHWILTAAALSDLDQDGQMEIIVNERDFPQGNIHILKLDGSSYSENWPITLDKTPAVTPSIGDVDNDGEKDIVVYSTESRYIFGLDGQPKPGFPLTTHPEQRYSFQSPLLVDFDEDDLLEIVGATHGDVVVPVPQFYVMNADGSDRAGWPKDIPDHSWTFNTPSVVKIDGEYRIFMSRPLGIEPGDMLYAWDPDGNLQEGFPIAKTGGLEGIISIADVDDDDEFELIFGANVIDTSGFGFIHAYEMDGSGEVAGFPIRPRGWTFLNGANVGDVNGDGMMDLVVLSYTQNFGMATDSAFLNVYELQVPYTPEKVLWATYKGSNTRDGLLTPGTISASEDIRAQELLELNISPNPASGITSLSFNNPAANYRIGLYDSSGRLRQLVFNGNLPAGKHNFKLELNNLEPGLYWINVRRKEGVVGVAKVVVP